MEKYIGTKVIKAKPMTRAEYNDYRGWDLPVDEDGTDEGFLVEYVDGGQANHKDHDGYISWSPKDVFSRAYKPVFGMSFSLALESIRLGRMVSRQGWNGKDMWLKLIRPENYNTNPGTGISLLPWIGMKTADNKFVPWLASQTDMLSDDWQVVGG